MWPFKKKTDTRISRSKRIDVRGWLLSDLQSLALKLGCERVYALDFRYGGIMMTSIGKGFLSINERDQHGNVLRTMQRGFAPDDTIGFYNRAITLQWKEIRSKRNGK
jgi:hypothetical protein